MELVGLVPAAIHATAIQVKQILELEARLVATYLQKDIQATAVIAVGSALKVACYLLFGKASWECSEKLADLFVWRMLLITVFFDKFFHLNVDELKFYACGEYVSFLIVTKPTAWRRYAPSLTLPNDI